jgi:hypothetical protein
MMWYSCLEGGVNQWNWKVGVVVVERDLADLIVVGKGTLAVVVGRLDCRTDRILMAVEKLVRRCHER